MRWAAWLLLISGCCNDPWSAYPMSVMPDTSCSTGGTHGTDVYIWNCINGQHVVIVQWSAEMSCHAPVRETAPCGSLTPLETRLQLTAAMCSGARPDREWR